MWHQSLAPRALLARIDQAHASARTRGIGRAGYAYLLTSAVCLRQLKGLAQRGPSVPKAKRPSPAGVLLTATPIALAADRGGGAFK
jgi:hypothetical protein